MFKRTLSLAIIVCFFLTSLGPLPKAHADIVLDLPAPGTMVNLSPAYQPVMIKGLTVHKDNPFLFDFIVDIGQDHMSGEPLKKEGEKLIKYFLASLTIPDKDVWVNLSPYEKNRMIPEVLSQTDMGRDLLEQDYVLKQITASLIYPEKQLGKKFWDTVYSKAQQMYGTTQIPVNTFNKVWIMADKADIYEHNQTVFVVGSHLKVMLDEDYLALQKHNHALPLATPSAVCSIGANIIKQIILPQLEQEINTGKNFANLRQIFNSVILSSWYKRNLKEALLNQVYSDKAKVKGINLNDPTIKEQIYQQYLKAYKKGVFNYIKEDINAAGTTIPRKYFSGGILSLAMTADNVTATPRGINEFNNAMSSHRFVQMSTGMVTNQSPARISRNAAMNSYAKQKMGEVQRIIEYSHGDMEIIIDKARSMFPGASVNRFDKSDFGRQFGVFNDRDVIFDEYGNEYNHRTAQSIMPISISLTVLNFGEGAGKIFIFERPQKADYAMRIIYGGEFIDDSKLNLRQMWMLISGGDGQRGLGASSLGHDLPNYFIQNFQSYGFKELDVELAKLAAEIRTQRVGLKNIKPVKAFDFIKDTKTSMSLLHKLQRSHQAAREFLQELKSSLTEESDLAVEEALAMGSPKASLEYHKTNVDQHRKNAELAQRLEAILWRTIQLEDSTPKEESGESVISVGLTQEEKREIARWAFPGQDNDKSIRNLRIAAAGLMENTFDPKGALQNAAVEPNSADAKRLMMILMGIQTISHLTQGMQVTIDQFEMAVEAYRDKVRSYMPMDLLCDGALREIQDILEVKLNEQQVKFLKDSLFSIEKFLGPVFDSQLLEEPINAAMSVDVEHLDFDNKTPVASKVPEEVSAMWKEKKVALQFLKFGQMINENNDQRVVNNIYEITSIDGQALREKKQVKVTLRFASSSIADGKKPKTIFWTILENSLTEALDAVLSPSDTMTPEDVIAADLGSKKEPVILYVVYDKISEFNMSKVLNRYQVKLVEARKRKDAMDVLRNLEGRVDLVIIDNNIPNVKTIDPDIPDIQNSGLALANDLQREYPHLPVILQSYDIPGMRDNGYKGILWHPDDIYANLPGILKNVPKGTAQTWPPTVAPTDNDNLAQDADEAMTDAGAKRLSGVDVTNREISNLVSMMIKDMRSINESSPGNIYVTRFLNIELEKRNQRLIDLICNEINGYRFKWTNRVFEGKPVYSSEALTVNIDKDDKTRIQDLLSQLELIQAQVEERSREVSSLIVKLRVNRGKDFESTAQQIIQRYSRLGVLWFSRPFWGDILSDSARNPRDGDIIIQGDQAFTVSGYIPASIKAGPDAQVGIFTLQGNRRIFDLDNPAMSGTKVSSSQKAWHGGGIDLSTSKGMRWMDSTDGHGVEMNINPAMIERVRREGVDSLSAIIFRITPITSIWPLAGLQAPAQADHLAAL